MCAVRIKVALIAAAALASSAASAAPSSQPAQPGPEVVKAAEFHLSIITSALKSPDVPNTMKGGLFGCLYEHPLGDISARVTKAFAANKQLKSDDPNIVLMVIAKICGAVIEPASKASGAGR
jgi:hypothetical protein